MFRLIEYYGRFQGVRGRIGGLPGWARGLILVAALPGVVLIGLSILALLGSILALLLFTVPLYRVLKAVAGPAVQPDGVDGPPLTEFPGAAAAEFGSRGRKKVDVTILE
jgi:hypothetical protein